MLGIRKFIVNILKEEIGPILDFNKATTWTPKTQYYIGDIVTWDMGVYIVYYYCKNNHISSGENPYDSIKYWSLLWCFANPIAQSFELTDNLDDWEQQDFYGASQKAIANLIKSNIK